MGMNCTVEFEFQSCPGSEDLHLVFESSFQSAGSQVDDLLLQQKTPNLCGSLVRSFGDCLKLALKLPGFVYQLVDTELRAQLNSGQKLEHAIVQLSGEPPALFLNGGCGNCTLQPGPAISFVFQVYPKRRPGIITSSTRQCRLLRRFMPLLARPRYRLSRRQAEVALQKFQRSWPRDLIGKMTIALFGVVHEGMTGIGIGVEIMLLIELG